MTHASAAPDMRLFWGRKVLDADVAAAYARSADAPHRRWMVDAVRAVGPSGRLLEIGCGTGVLLRQLAALDGVSCAVGLDVSEDAVAVAQRAGLFVRWGLVPESLTDCYTARQFDVTVSSYCLAYLNPEALVDALAALLRVTDRCVLLVEPTVGEGQPSTAAYGDDERYMEWRHDYATALRSAAARCRPSPRVDLTWTPHDPHEGLDGLMIGRLTWP